MNKLKQISKKVFVFFNGWNKKKHVMLHKLHYFMMVAMAMWTTVQSVDWWLILFSHRISYHTSRIIRQHYTWISMPLTYIDYQANPAHYQQHQIYWHTGIIFHYIYFQQKKINLYHYSPSHKSITPKISVWFLCFGFGLTEYFIYDLCIYIYIWFSNHRPTVKERRKMWLRW